MTVTALSIFEFADLSFSLFLNPTLMLSHDLSHSLSPSLSLPPSVMLRLSSGVVVLWVSHWNVRVLLGSWFEPH